MTDKEKQIQEMAKELHCATNESFISCRKIARILVERRGYGNVKRAVKEFADELKRRFMKHYPTAYKDAIYQFTDVEIDELIKERFGEEE